MYVYVIHTDHYIQSMMEKQWLLVCFLQQQLTQTLKKVNDMLLIYKYKILCIHSPYDIVYIIHIPMSLIPLMLVSATRFALQRTLSLSPSTVVSRTLK